MFQPASILILALVSASKPGWAEEGLTGENVDAAIRRALPYVAERGAWWIEEKGCVSCHRTAFTTWTLSAAARAGFGVDGDQVAEWRRWNVESVLAPVEDNDDETDEADEADDVLAGSKNVEGVAQIVLARQEADRKPADDETTAKLVNLLVAGQQEDGTWKPGGQLPSQRRPVRETALVSTAWNALTLGTVSTEAAREARSKAVAAMAAEKITGVSTEWPVARLLLAVQSGDDKAVAAGVESLKAAQRGTGGWGWLLDEEPNAYGTGLVLYAFARAGVSPKDEAVRRGVRFLVTAQDEDGSWAVPGTKKNAKGKVVETARYWGTCWAVLGLLESRSEN